MAVRERAHAGGFAAALIDWHAHHGRHDLPWQRHRTPYRVWVSEIMLQQTQVATVVPYYERFMLRFPAVGALAAASLDDVLHLWSGLGYYARARNLHRAAVRIAEEHGGRFPQAFEAVASLPGIGRSTAGAILALSRGQRFPILDGNVRRVLSRHFGVEGSTSDRATLEKLWSLSDECTPVENVDTYTQAVMDLGATVCVRRNPSCAACPVASTCVARRTGRQHELPAPRPARPRRLRQVFMLAAVRDDGDVLLQRRPERGIWGGLWCLPEFASATAAAEYARHALRDPAARPVPLAAVEHAFTHFDLVITPLLAHCSGSVEAVPLAVPGGRADSGGERPARMAGPKALPPTASGLAPNQDGARALAEGTPLALWYRVREPANLGLPAPIRLLLERLASAAGAQAQLFD
ncbi:MAG TPA: A/G-specific adenine glycosylase [Steroidobacteraceae bacterium]|nr:A/G-specific adenine glycosylase [Steroidobacteraceae bacterium]